MKLEKPKILYENIIGKIIIYLIFTLLIMERIRYFHKYTNINSGNIKVTIASYAASFALVSLLLSISFMLNLIGEIIYDFVIYIFLTIILMIDKLYYSYASNFSSVYLVKELGFKSEISSALTRLIGKEDKIISVILAIVLVVCIFAIDYIRKHNKKIKDDLKKYRMLTFISGFIITLLCIGCSLGLFQKAISRTKKSNPALFLTMFSKKALIEYCGPLTYHYYDIKSYMYDRKTLDKLPSASDVQTFYNNKEKQQPNKYTGIGKNMNVIVLQFEAFENFLINQKINGKEITPNLNKFLSENIKLSNFHSQTYLGSTSDAEFSANTSLYPINNGSAYYFYPKNNYYCLAKMFKENGYYSSVMHGNDKGFWNRDEMYKDYNYDVFESAENFSKKDIEWNGASDKEFFSEAVDKFINYKKPFFSFMITLTSHFPYTTNGGKDLNVGEYQGTLLGDYLQAVHYTDEAFGEFIDKLKEKGLYDNTIIVLYGDHIAVPLNNEDLLAKFLYNEKSLTEIQTIHRTNVVGGIRIPGINPYEITTPKSQIDIMPTLGNLLGVETKYALGHDIFSSYDKVFFKNGNIIYNNYFYDASLKTWYDVKTGKESKKDFTKILNEYYKTLNVSDSIIKRNLLK